MEACFAVCDASYKQGKQPSGSSPSFLCCSTQIAPPFFPCLNAVPTRRLSLSLSLTLAFRHFDILWHNVEIRGTQRSFSFYFFNPNDLQRLSPCRERVVYPPLVAVCRGRGGTLALPSVFLSLYAFCLHAESFSLSLPSFCHQVRVLRISRNAER